MVLSGGRSFLLAFRLRGKQGGRRYITTRAWILAELRGGALSIPRRRSGSFCHEVGLRLALRRAGAWETPKLLDIFKCPAPLSHVCFRSEHHQSNCCTSSAVCCAAEALFSHNHGRCFCMDVYVLLLYSTPRIPSASLSTITIHTQRLSRSASLGSRYYKNIYTLKLL